MTTLIKTTATTAGGGNVSRLKAHLLSGENESVKILNGNLGLLNTYEDIAQLAGHKYAFNHCVISPKANVTPEQLDHIVQSVLNEYGASEFCLVEHSKKRADKTNFPHFHLVFESTKNARVLSKKDSYLRNEYLSRKAELFLGMELGVGKHNKYVFDRLKKEGLIGGNEVGGTLGKSQAYSQRQHQKAKRIGINLPAIAYEISQLGGGETFYKALIQIEQKYNCRFEKGDKSNVVLIRNLNGEDAGKVNTILGLGRGEAKQFFKEFEQAKRDQFSEAKQEPENRVPQPDTTTLTEDRSVDRVAEPSPDRDTRGGDGTGRDIRTDMPQPDDPRREMHEDRKQPSRVADIVASIRTILSQRSLRNGSRNASGYSGALQSIANSSAPEYPTINKKNAWSFLKRWAAAYAQNRGMRI